MTKKNLIHEETGYDYRKQYDEYGDEIAKRKIGDSYLAQIQHDLQEELDRLLSEGIVEDIAKRHELLEPLIKQLEEKLKSFNRRYVYRIRQFTRCDEAHNNVEPEIITGQTPQGRKWTAYDYPNTRMPSVKEITLNTVNMKQVEALRTEMLEPEVTLKSIRRQIKMYEKVNGKLNPKRDGGK